MKKTSLFVLLTCLFSIILNAQSNEIKEYDFRSYKSPDLKYRTLQTGTNLMLNGYQRKSDNTSNMFGGNIMMDYYQYVNNSKFQGSMGAFAIGSYISEWGKYDDEKSKISDLYLSINYDTYNRFYNAKNVFIGLNGNFIVRYDPEKSKTEEYHRNDVQIYFAPIISVGKGRIEPISSARKAVDILHSLQKSDRLADTIGHSIIDSLAIVINKLQYERVFDSRLRRIYQLEELDKTLHDMHIISKTDITYFSILNDIWEYAQTNNRGSGNRFETGIIPVYNLDYQKEDVQKIPSLMESMDQIYGIYGEFSFVRERPLNYTWQSDLISSITIGYAKEHVEYINNSFENLTQNNYLKGLLNLSWRIGYYPNTRTYASIVPYVSISYNDKIDMDSEIWGLNTGLRFHTYYYVSPRFRLAFEADLIYYNNFDYSTPSSNSYYKDYLNNYRVTEQRLTYNVGVNLIYSIL